MPPLPAVAEPAFQSEMSLTVATWNINGIKARLETVLDWLRQTEPDIAALQEIKSIDEGFPGEAFESIGYNVATHGQKSFNGVALLSKRPLEDIRRGLPGEESDVQARYIEGVVSLSSGRSLRIGCLYLPNGNPTDSDKYPYKLAWMDRLITHAQDLLKYEEPLLLIGDYNVIPADEDVHDPHAWTGDALCLPQTRQRFRALKNLGFYDAFYACDRRSGQYSFWDYQAGAWPKNNGIRIDHVMMSPHAIDLLQTASIERPQRGSEKPSDHVPVVVTLDD